MELTSTMCHVKAALAYASHQTCIYGFWNKATDTILRLDDFQDVCGDGSV